MDRLQTWIKYSRGQKAIIGWAHHSPIKRVIRLGQKNQNSKEMQALNGRDRWEYQKKKSSKIEKQKRNGEEKEDEYRVKLILLKVRSRWSESAVEKAKNMT